MVAKTVIQSPVLPTTLAHQNRENVPVVTMARAERGAEGVVI